ncbi:PAS domain-containing protein [Dongia sp.]|uniref:PAS domain-containing protein n=1 Tax=Dongia sp. TaxID=1977262 RepID=UPI0035B49EA6
MTAFDLTHIQHPALRELFCYWRGLSINGGIPRRRDIDPTALRKQLPHIYLLDIGPTADDLRYRLAGGLIVEAFGFEPGGWSRREIRARHVDPSRYDEFDRTSAETYRIVTERIVAYTHDHMTSYRRDYLGYARLNMPISEQGVTPSGIIGAIYLSSDRAPFWADFKELHEEFPLADALSAEI